MKHPLLFLFVLLLFSCTDQPQHDQPAGTTTPHRVDTTLLKGKWLLHAINHDTALSHLYPMGKPFIAIDYSQQRIGGFSGCNHFGGGAVITPKEMKLTGPVQSTLIGCPGTGDGQFIQYMNAVRKYEVTKDSLFLYDSATTRLRFTRFR
jgi:heat shock protein HslJ